MFCMRNAQTWNFRFNDNPPKYSPGSINTPRGVLLAFSIQCPVDFSQSALAIWFEVHCIANQTGNYMCDYFDASKHDIVGGHIQM